MNDLQNRGRSAIAELLLEVVPRLMQKISSEAQSGGSASILTTSQLRVLGALVRGRRLPSEVARDLKITPATASELVDALARRGLVERRDDPDDRRVSVLYATEAGIEAWHAGRDRALGALELLVAELNPAETHALEVGLRAISELFTAKASAHGRVR